MLHKPTYCCNCGDKVDRIEWHIWNSRKYCELCETEFQFDEWWPRAAVFIILVFGFTGIGFHIGGKDERPGARSRMLASPQNRAPEKILNSNTGKPAVDRSAGSGAISPGPPEQVPPKVELENAVPSPEIADSPQEVYYCGALTKKGTPCARRVKHGGRCWQHKNQPSK